MSSFGSSSSLDQKYALTERDKATGLDHTWFRKHENQAGRWTSPDPYNGSMNIGNPQSFNRYSYVNNQPTNYVDPSGLREVCYSLFRFEYGYKDYCFEFPDYDYFKEDRKVRGGDLNQSKNINLSNDEQKKFDACAKKAYRAFRSTYIKDGATTLVGGAIIIGGVLVLVAGARYAAGAAGAAGAVGFAGIAESFDVLKVTGVAVTAYFGAGGALIYKAIESTGNAEEKLKKALDKCKKESPNADHSLSYLTL